MKASFTIEDMAATTSCREQAVQHVIFIFVMCALAHMGLADADGKGPLSVMSEVVKTVVVHLAQIAAQDILAFSVTTTIDV